MPVQLEREKEPMLDKPEKTAELISTLRSALPFEVSLTPELIAELARHEKPLVLAPSQVVSEITYAGDAGGILCHIQIADVDQTVFASLTHVRVSRTLPFAQAVIEYQKHRVKKLRKQRTLP